MKILPPELRNTEQANRLYEFGCVTEMDIVQLIYRPHEPQGACKDYEFSRVTMNTAGSKGIRTPAPRCRPRRGSRQHHRTSACACSM